MILEAQNISKKYGKNLIFSKFSYTFEKGNIYAITGVSGKGKTTLLNCLGLLVEVTDGDIFYNNTKISNLGYAKKLKYFRHVFGFLFQNYGLIDTWSVSSNLDIALQYKKNVDKTAAKIDALTAVGLSNKIDAKIHTLSGGQQQRVALAKLILKAPDIILCDEPSAALDEQNTNIVIGQLKQMASKGKIVLVATHDPLVVNRCDKIVSL